MYGPIKYLIKHRVDISRWGQIIVIFINYYSYDLLISQSWMGSHGPSRIRVPARLLSYQRKERKNPINRFLLSKWYLQVEMAFKSWNRIGLFRIAKEDSYSYLISKSTHYFTGQSSNVRQVGGVWEEGLVDTCSKVAYAFTRYMLY